MKLESQMNKIYEYVSELDARKEDYKKLEKQYVALLEVVKDSGRFDEFPEGFMEQMQQCLDNILIQQKHLELRCGYGKMIRDIYEKDDETRNLVEQIVTLMFNIFGVDVSDPNEEQEG